MRLRIAIVMAVLAAALLLPGLARADDGSATATDVAVVTVNGFSDGNGVPSTDGFSDGNSAPSAGSTDGFADGNSGTTTDATSGSSADAGGADVGANFGMSDGNG